MRRANSLLNKPLAPCLSGSYYCDGFLSISAKLATGPSGHFIKTPVCWAGMLVRPKMRSCCARGWPLRQVAPRSCYRWR